MLKAIGASSLDALIDELVPRELQLQGALALPPSAHELELEQEVRAAASRNDSATSHACFMGCGAYDHFVPAVVDEIAARGEYYTSYTPYQAEVSQGNLQVMFEYETLVTQLTGLGVSNASLYDGGSAATEAVLMSLAIGKGRSRVVVSSAVHPEYRQILAAYLKNLNAQLVVVDVDATGTSAAMADCCDEQTACVLIQHPNFFGRVEDVASISQAAHDHGALVVQVFDPISLGCLRRPGDLGVDIAVAEGQVLGNRLAFGGPYLGIMACRDDLVRRLPGRIAGQTTDRRGKRCWVLTLQTREQHIRRDKATSNICSNQTLLALRAAVYLSALGPYGLQDTATHCVRKAAYAKHAILRSDRFESVFAGSVFKEFVIRDRAGDVQGLLAHARASGILAGVDLGRWYPELSDCFSVAVTEKRSQAEIDRWVDVLANAPASIQALSP